MNSIRIKNKITLELTRDLDKDGCVNDAVITILINNNMIQKTGIEAEEIFDKIKDMLEEDYEDIVLED